MSGRLHVSLTRVYDGQNILVSQFDTKEEIIQVSMLLKSSLSIEDHIFLIRLSLPLALYQSSHGFSLKDTKVQELLVILITYSYKHGKVSFALKIFSQMK